MLVAGLCGLLGLLAGFSIGHIHGLHGACPQQTQPRATVWDREASLRREFEHLTDRIALLEADAGHAGDAECPPRTKKCPPAKNCTCDEPCKEVVEYASDLEGRVETLLSALAENRTTQKAELGRSGWRNVLPTNREALWSKHLAGFPYTAGATGSFDALVFDRGTECKEMDVVVAPNKKDVCLAVFDSRLPIYTMLRFDNTKGSLLEAERKKAAPKKHKAAPAEAYSEERLKNRALIVPQHVETMPKTQALRESLAATASFTSQVPRLISLVKEKIRKHQLNARYNIVVVMATNLGTLDLVANFICSCGATEDLQKVLSHVLVFAADEYSQHAVEALNVASFYDRALGELPEDAATTYGDKNFVRMMWLKVTSVYLVVATKANVLFQDADVVWLRDPLPHFHSKADPEVDAFFMDDGARSQRYTPFYANTGFYFLRNNDRVSFFLHRLLLAYDVILTVRSHQHALIMLLVDHVAKFGLTVNILDKDLFPQGQIFHHKKRTMQLIIDGTIPAFVFHMCWTAGRKDKLTYLKNMGLWFLEPSCTIDHWYTARPDPSALTSSACCNGLKPFQAPTPYVQKITLSSK